MAIIDRQQNVYDAITADIAYQRRYLIYKKKERPLCSLHMQYKNFDLKQYF